MKFTKFNMRMFNEAKKEAEKSDFARFHIGCVITYKRHIVGRGCNSDKTNPLQAEYNHFREFNECDVDEVRHAVHAEIKAISSISFTTKKDVDFSRASIYIYRICEGKENGYGKAKPCPACLQAISDLGIKDIYFTDDEGLSYLKLD